MGFTKEDALLQTCSTSSCNGLYAIMRNRYDGRFNHAVSSHHHFSNRLQHFAWPRGPSISSTVTFSSNLDHPPGSLFAPLPNCDAPIVESCWDPSRCSDLTFTFKPSSLLSSMSSISPDPNVTPALAAPPGFTSNLVNPPSQAYVTIVVQIVLLLLVTPFVFVRLFTRYYVLHGLWWDDGKLFPCSVYL